MGLLTLVPVLDVLSLLLGCHVQLQYDSFCFILLYFVLLLSLKSLVFTNERQKGSGSRGGWEELGGIERGETIIRIYYVVKESIFNKRKT